jgi:hypothetical protein
VNIEIEHNGSTYSGQIMTIKSTSLGYEDHGILTAWLHCESERGSGVGVGGYSLDTAEKDDDGKFLRRVGTQYGLDHLIAIMRTVGVESWEKLTGAQVVVLSSGRGGWGSQSVGIAGLQNNQVMILKEHAEQWRGKSEVAAP